MSAQSNELTLWGFTKNINRNWLSAILILLIGGNIGFATKWILSESEKNKCYQESVLQEQRHSKEKESIFERQLDQAYKIGELTAKVEQLAKLRKK
jgi:hypothetical protein